MLPGKLLSRAEAGLLFVLSARDIGGRRRLVVTAREGQAGRERPPLGRLTIPRPS